MSAKRPKLPPSYENHADERKRVRVKVDATFGDRVVAAGETGTVRWVQPSAEVNLYMVKIDGDEADTLYERGVRGFRKAQLEFLS